MEALIIMKDNIKVLKSIEIATCSETTKSCGCQWITSERHQRVKIKQCRFYAKVVSDFSCQAANLHCMVCL